MENGKVIFEGGIKPADGVELRVDVVAPAPEAAPPEDQEAGAERPLSLSEVLLKYAGCMDDPSLPTDGSINHDHYIYGTPKR